MTIRTHDNGPTRRASHAILGDFSALIRWALLANAVLNAGGNNAFAAKPTPEQSEYFELRIRPLLAERCYECHSNAAKEVMGGLRLDSREAILAGGDSGAAVVEGAPEKSRLITAVRYSDPDLKMPPPKDGADRKLSDVQIADLARWVKMGVPIPSSPAAAGKTSEKHWAFQPLHNPPLPAVKDKAWPRNPIDRFVLARIEERGLQPTRPADKRTLIRRVTFDITGLPPTPEEAECFVADTSPNAYEKLVDRLLASPRHGEHWARHWLDVANYADTHGNDHDYARPNAWPYRDYVIQAFNDDKPYRRFVEEQVAGDALYPNDPQATVALGFVAAGPWDHTLMVTIRADTVDHRIAQNLDRDNMVSTVFGTFESLTVHCARCHNHKFDPISQREYYSLQAVFAGVDRADRPFDADPRTYAQRKRLLAEKPALDRRDAALLESPAVAQRVAALEAAYANAEKAWTPLDIVHVVSTGGATLTRQADGSWLASGTRPDRDTYIVTAHRRAGRLSAMRLQVLPHASLPQHGPGRWDNGNFHLSEFRAFAAIDGKSQGAKAIAFARATADYDEGPNIAAAQTIDGRDDTQWGIHLRYGVPHEAIYEIKEPAAYPEGTTFTVLLEFQDGFKGHGIGRFQLSASDDMPAIAGTTLPAETAAVLYVPAPQRTAAQRRELALFLLMAENKRALAALPAPHFVYAVTNDFPPDGDSFRPPPQPRPIHVLARGDIEKPGELVGPGTLGCVPEMPKELAIADAGDEAARRAALARWLTDDRNALTWRSIVNRIWSYHFGRGICDTPSDFGKMGGAPSHAELLDWLAVWFRDEARGSLKALHRLIVTSATYRQAVMKNAAAAELDGDNRLLWRMNRQRLSGEEVRDAVLQFSGKLDLTMGGPSVVQFISKGDATFNSGGNPAFLDYEHFDPDAPAARRRAVYRFLFRTVPDPFMDALDCPDGGAATPVRGVSTTAVQAFAMLNDSFLIRQCEHVAAHLSAKANSSQAQVESAFRLILLRAPRDDERAKFAAYIQRYGLANACQILLNSNEFLYLD
jgi:hypothetical protein